MRLILTSGLTLFEVLVSLLLLSLAFLGLDVMELASLRINRGAYYSALAEQQIHNLEERLRLPRADFDQLFQAWNRENKILLPQGNGQIRGQDPEYHLSLCWSGNEEGQTPCLNETFRL